jgi:phosphohistidine phosphatase SixA
MNVLEHLVPELGHKNQVDMHHENTVPASANVLHVSHNPSM